MPFGIKGVAFGSFLLLAIFPSRIAAQAFVNMLIRASIVAKQRLPNNAGAVLTIARTSEILISALLRGNKIILLGNGSSAADAQHVAAEFVGRFGFDRPALPALAPSINKLLCYGSRQRLRV